MLLIVTLVLAVVIFLAFTYSANNKRTIKHSKIETRNIPDGLTIVDIAEFKAKYGYSPIVPDEIFWLISDAEGNGQKHIAISISTLEKIEADYRTITEFNESIARCSERNNIGIALEKKGDIERAIAIYEENVADTYLAMHSYERLMIIYRRNKDYDNELRIIELAINKFSSSNYNRYSKDIIKWKARRTKVQTLMNKQK